MTLTEDVTLNFGIDGEDTTEYELRRVIFHLGNSSTRGHYTVAVRQQRNGKCSQSDNWLYFDSAASPVTYTLSDLNARFSRNVTGILLVAKANPLLPASEGYHPKSSKPRCATCTTLFANEPFCSRLVLPACSLTVLLQH